jgi:exo-beta-1,3-glucanase (GH17 family)
MRNRPVVLFRIFGFLLLLTATVFGCNEEGEEGRKADPSSVAAAGNGIVDGETLPTFPPRLHGLNFGPYLKGQDPHLGSQITEAQLRGRIARIAPYTEWIRTYGSTYGLEDAGRIAHEFNLKIACSAWLSRDLEANARELKNLIEAARGGHCDMAVVGSEVLLRGDLSEEALISVLNRVRRKLPGIPVATADSFRVVLAHPAVIAAVDVVWVNYYPYWEGISIDQAVATLDGWHRQVVAAAGGKAVIISETGWPTCGNRVGAAAPSPENAARYFAEFTSWARAHSVPSFYFEAYDEAWKAAHEGPQGACWGIWDQDGNVKPGMAAIF